MRRTTSALWLDVAAPQVLGTRRRDAERIVGSTCDAVTMPSWTSQTCDVVVVVSSSRPSSPRKTHASTPRRASTPAIIGAIRRSAQPTAWAAGLTGLASGPRTLKVVGMRELAPRTRGVPHRRVERRREAERDADLLGEAGHLVGPQVQPDAERLEHVGGAGLRGRRAVAVLDHARARRRPRRSRPSSRCSRSSSGRRRCRRRRARGPGSSAAWRRRTSRRAVR